MRPPLRPKKLLPFVQRSDRIRCRARTETDRIASWQDNNETRAGGHHHVKDNNIQSAITPVLRNCWQVVSLSENLSIGFRDGKA